MVADLTVDEVSTPEETLGTPIVWSIDEVITIPVLLT
jgi:hypothetical protein